ncbi:MAG: NAD(P)-dependent oxidoreductase [Alphaproteobacteria bacterium]
MTKVGFIGLGTMGASFASNVQKAGFDLTVHDLHRQLAERHVQAGAGWAASPKALGEECEVVLTSLPGPPEVDAVVLDAAGLAAGLKPGSAIFDLSTNSPSRVRRLHGLLAEKGIHFFDAPVSGGPKGAASGKCAIWVGGDEAVFNKYKHVLDAMGDQVRRIGDIGAGSIAKLAHNAAGYAMQTAFAEVMAMGVKGGLDPLALWSAIRQGARGRQRSFDFMADQYMVDQFDPPAFALKLAHKDVSLAAELGRELGVPMRMINMTLAELTEALGRGWEGRDSRVAMTLQNERAGITVKADPARVRQMIENE